jgi:rhamnogalacturonyl hydrolase YesR
MKWLKYILITGFLLASNLLYAGGAEEQILRAVRECAEYAANTLLDSAGRSRCDYNMTEGRWYDYEPPWHTGQIIYALVDAFKVTGDSSYLRAATKAGDWWVSLEIKDHSKLTGMVDAIHGDHAGQVIVFATVSDGTAGLFRLYRLTGVRKYAEVPTKAGDWMLKHMWVPEYGVFYDNVDPETGDVIKENSPFWPDKKEQTLYDVARPNNEGSLYKDMYEFTGDEKYKQIFIELCESLVAKQGPEGLWMDFMPNHKAEGSFHPRFNLWYAESLLEGYDLTRDKRYLEAALKTARMYAKYQKSEGTIYYENYLNGTSNESSVCGSAVAFAGIIWLRLLHYGVGDEFKENIEKSLTFVMKNRFASDHPDPNLAGAVLNTRTRHRKGKIWLVNRDVGTSFGLRFLCDYYHHLKGWEK